MLSLPAEQSPLSKEMTCILMTRSASVQSGSLAQRLRRGKNARCLVPRSFSRHRLFSRLLSHPHGELTCL